MRTFSIKVKNFMSKGRRDFIRRAKGVSFEVCHNLVRLILRPNHKSANHWRTELVGLMHSSLCSYYSIKELPTYYFIHELSGPDDRFIYDNSLESLIEMVELEDYGDIKDLNLDEVKEKIYNFIKVLPRKGTGTKFKILIDIVNNFKF